MTLSVLQRLQTACEATGARLTCSGAFRGIVCMAQILNNLRPHISLLNQSAIGAAS